MKDSTLVILGETDSFTRWDASLRARLAKRDLTGHVIHDDIDVDPVVRPKEPVRNMETDEEWEKIWKEHRREVLSWKNHETEARNIILERLSDKIWPRDHVRMSAKALYDSVTMTRKESSSAPYIEALRQLLETKMSSSIEDYCDRFSTAYQNVLNSAETLSASDPTPIDRGIPEATAAGIFLVGTLNVEWLNSWRDNKAIDASDRPVSLKSMMSSIRTVAANHSYNYPPHTQNSVATASLNEPPNSYHQSYPDAICKKCRHKHKNKECFKQHPELAVGPKGQKWLMNQEIKKNEAGKGKGKSAVDPDDNVDSNGGVMLGVAASASFNRIPYIYDTGASHHFVPMRNAFIKLQTRPSPFKFDQAVGEASLSLQGTAKITIGTLNLQLQDCLFSPNSSSVIISAGRLHRIANILPDYSRNLLVYFRKERDPIPIASLVLLNDVYYIRPLINSSKISERTTIAPGVARTQTNASAQLWHQRLGHIGQKILKKTLQNSEGLNGLDTSELKTCETCHLSKAQRYVSREPRPTPHEPLDEVFVDTVGKLPQSINGNQYAVILTDAKTRMRWVLTVNTKDQIAPLLVQWAKTMHHQYGKSVRTIFRDGGTEFIKTKTFCDSQGIRTDISAPETPEQNGAAEAANKVILRVARSLLIDARMPPCYWYWAVKHSCFLINRLYCLRTKKVPIIDFLQGLRQPHPEKIDFRSLPRFGCRAYKLIDPKPSKFEPRAEKGWFVGFQPNTSKNFIIYHPHHTPVQGWKWIESVTPHSSFNENIVFGDQIKSCDLQNNINYWADDRSIFHNRELRQSNMLDSTYLDDQQPEQPQQPDHAHSISKPKTLQDIQTHDSNKQPLIVQNQNSDTFQAPQSTNQPSQISPQTPPIPNNTWDLTHKLPDTLNSEIQSTYDSEYESDYQNNQNDYDNSDNESDFQDNQYESDKESENLERLPASLSPSHSQQPNPEIDSLQPQHDFIMTGWDPVKQQAGNKRKRSPNRSITPVEKHIADTEHESPDTEYDRIMTGWDPIQPTAGHKRAHSPEAETYTTKRGRQVKKVNYYQSHHGLAVHPSTDPKTWKEAMASPESAEWMAAAIEEINSLRSKGAIKIINRNSLPKGRTPMKCKWVFKKKFLADGRLDKFRARCTAKGYTQRPGIDYHETFAPTPRPETGRIMLVLAHQMGWHRCQGDVPTAFLNPDLNIDLFMEIPEGFEKPGYIIHLKKSIYGLKQAAALWYDDAKATLANLGLYPTISDVCLYINKQKTLFVLLHVDDFQVMGPNRDELNNLMNSLFKKYKIKSVDTNLFLGINIKQSNQKLTLSQEQYSKNLLKRHNLENCKSVNTPLEKLMEHYKSHSSKELIKEYNSIVGGLQYLANNTRPDIAFAVNHLARFLSNPTQEHLQAARRVLRYISKQPDKGISFTRTEGMSILEAYSDADFAADPSSSRSTSGSLIRLSSGPICWKSHLQREVVLSTTEAEFLAATETCRQLRWVKTLLQELGIENYIDGSKRTNLYVDNQSAISLIRNHDNHKRSKHISLRNFYCREQYQKGRIFVKYVQSSDQLADSLTKAKSSVPLH